MIERLDRRRLLSTLTITGSASNDVIRITELTKSSSGSTINVTNGGKSAITLKVDSTSVTLAAGATKANPSVKAGTKITAIVANLFSGTANMGNDAFAPVGTLSIPVSVFGGAGNNTLTGGSGNDSLVGMGGKDSITGGDGNDTVRAGDGADTLHGGNGNDYLQDDGGNDVSFGEVGDDTLTGYEGSDTLTGSTGNDTYLWGDPAAAQTDTVVELANGGTDTLDFSQSGVGSFVSVNLGSSSLATQSKGLRLVKTPSGDQANFEDITGTPGADHLVGNSAANIIDGGAGKDSIEGADGNDTLFGGDDNDTLLGGNGNDSLLGQSQDDSLAGGLGDDDYVFGKPTQTQTDTVNEAASAGNDQLDFGTGATAVVVNLTSDSAIAKYKSGAFTRTVKMAAAGQSANIEIVAGSTLGDSITGNSRNNTIFGAGGDDTIVGGAGDDSIDAGSGNDKVNGNDGNDTISGAIGNDTLHGDAGDDLIIDYSGTNQLFGDADDDVFINQNNNVDTIDGGDGFDSAQQDKPGDKYTNVEYLYDVISGSGNPGAVHAAAARPAAAPSAVTAVIDSKKILRVTGTDGKDSISVLQTGTVLTVNASGKTFTFSTTKLAIASGKPSIEVDGNGGDDSISLASSSGSHPVLLTTRVKGGDGNDNIMGGNGSDALEGDAGNDTVNGGAGNDLLSGDYLVLFGEAVPAGITGPDGNDKIIGGSGDTDVVSYTYRTSAVTLNLSGGTALSGGKDEKDTISGVEKIVGGQGADSLIGSSLSDILLGGQGNDTIAGGAGADFMFGGLGSDSLKPDSGSDYLDTGVDSVADSIQGSYKNDGVTAPTGMANNILFVTPEKGDYFSMSKTTYNG